ncbi:4Fe-4S dicluster domain-containing protein [Nocardioides sp. GCM10027113]|uniref:4Fe-4S dicluster domain-containing protein n=1 Tax=unclassified Nocardioides TaxID=2615069 RepID=UPI00360B03D6
MQYGFAIDHRTCIGCHACTVACKTEHGVPLGQFRTWVKYVDSGTFPESTRDFGVLRCNHCTDAPCVTICPTEALFKREDGIVDFDNSVCIGCKACMQACPYDALYIDEDTHTAAKCNFCAHRVDDGLEPACVVVCPTESIWVGDLDDADSAISRFVASNETQVRAPEQGTGPNVHYVGASPAVLDPLAAPVDSSYIWAQPDSLRTAVARDLPVDPATNARTTLNTAHPVVWGWKVTSYLWTKGVAAGAMMIAPVAALTGAVDVGNETLVDVVTPLVAMAGLLATAVLLIADLKRPERFLYLMTRPHLSSWLVKGGFVLAAAAGVSFLWFLLALLDVDGPLPFVMAVGVVAGALTAGYTAFLFGQAEGRDLWQSPWLFWHLLAQAVMVGGGALLLLSYLTGSTDDLRTLLAAATAVGLVWHLAITLLEHGWAGNDHGTANARAARTLMTRGRHAATYHASLVAGLVALACVALFLLTGADALAVLGALLVQPSLVAYEHVFVRAAQEVPLS